MYTAMGCCQSREDRTRRKIAKRVKKDDALVLDIDTMFDEAYHAQPIPYYHSYVFAKKKGGPPRCNDEFNIHHSPPPKPLGFCEGKITDYILHNIDDHSKVWKALNLIGYYGSLSNFVKDLPDDIQIVCKSVLTSHFERREVSDVSLLNATHFAFLYNM